MTKTIKEEFYEKFDSSDGYDFFDSGQRISDVWSWFDQKLKEEYQRGKSDQWKIDLELIKSKP